MIFVQYTDIMYESFSLYTSPSFSQSPCFKISRKLLSLCWIMYVNINSLIANFPVYVPDFFFANFLSRFHHSAEFIIVGWYNIQLLLLRFSSMRWISVEYFFCVTLVSCTLWCVCTLNMNA